MRCPEWAWWLLMSAVDIIDESEPGRAGKVALLLRELDHPPPADGPYDRDLVLRPVSTSYDRRTDIETLLGGSCQA
ncbi:hypothetical protein LV79_003775 [Actinokineospora globicatena]|nr:hypothetical protein [Actinokineospora globicatena]